MTFEFCPCRLKWQESRAYLQAMTEAACEYVYQEWALIDALARRLLAYKRLTGEQVIAFLDARQASQGL